MGNVLLFQTCVWSYINFVFKFDFGIAFPDSVGCLLQLGVLPDYSPRCESRPCPIGWFDGLIMPGEDNDGENQRPLRAGRSLHQAFVRFVNRSHRRVDIIWLNYEGFGMKYKTLLSCQFVDVNTFVGHPWIFRDADSGDRMVVQLKEVFEPTGWNSEEGGRPQRKVVYITIPGAWTSSVCLMR